MQLIVVHSFAKQIDGWTGFFYDRDLRHERVKPTCSFINSRNK